MKKTDLFSDYYIQWVEMYKLGSVRPVTLEKYYLTHRELKQRLSGIRLCDIDHYVYQKLINEYAETHEYLTVKDFHHHCKAAIVDAIEDGLIQKNPTRHLVLKGKEPKLKKPKYLSLLDLKRLINQFNLGNEINIDWMLFLIAKTGMRLAEALGLTPMDFDFKKHTIRISKTWDYKSNDGSFQPTKNKSSIRTINIDPITSEQFQRLIEGGHIQEPLFVPKNKRVFISTINYRLKTYCKRAGVNVISVHGLRHTHASLLIYDGVSIPSVAKRLGHANTITTQKTYLHIVKELEERDNQKILENMIRLS